MHVKLYVHRKTQFTSRSKAVSRKPLFVVKLDAFNPIMRAHCIPFTALLHDIPLHANLDTKVSAVRRMLAGDMDVNCETSGGRWPQAEWRAWDVANDPDMLPMSGRSVHAYKQ